MMEKVILHFRLVEGFHHGMVIMIFGTINKSSIIAFDIDLIKIPHKLFVLEQCRVVYFIIGI